MRSQENPEIQVLRFTTINNIKDSADLAYDKGECVDICNMDMTKDAVLSRRQGYTSVSATGTNNGWSNSSGAYYVQGTTLYKFDSTPRAIATILGNVSYCDLQDCIAYSSLNGTGFFPSLPATSTNDLDDEFERPVSTLTAQAMAYWNGRLYLGVGGYLYCSKTYKFNVYDYRSAIAASYTDGIVSIKAVNSGLYVFTRSESYFLSGGDPFEESFNQKIVLPYGVLPGQNGQVVPAGFIDPNQSGKAVVITSYKGICICFEGGNVINKSQGNISYPIGTSCGDAIHERNGANVYVVNINNDNNTPYNANEEWILDINEVSV